MHPVVTAKQVIETYSGNETLMLNKIPVSIGARNPESRLNEEAIPVAVPLIFGRGIQLEAENNERERKGTDLDWAMNTSGV